MTYFLYILGIIFVGILILIIMFIRDYLRLKSKKRRRWALSVGLPARISVKDQIRKKLDQANKAKSRVTDADADIHLKIDVPSLDAVQEQLELIGFSFSKEDNENTANAKLRILARFTNQQSQHLSYQQKGFTVKDTVAWDATMLVEEARIAASFKWISEEEIWGVIFLNAQRVQDTFSSWRDFTDHCVRGRELEMLARKGKYASPRVSQEIDSLFSDRDSAFTELAWRDFEIINEDDIRVS